VKNKPKPQPAPPAKGGFNAVNKFAGGRKGGCSVKAPKSGRR
jgi:hypothetical protein